MPLAMRLSSGLVAGTLKFRVTEIPGLCKSKDLRFSYLAKMNSYSFAVETWYPYSINFRSQQRECSSRNNHDETLLEP